MTTVQMNYTGVVLVDNNLDIKIGLLRSLRSLFHEGAVTNSPSPLELVSVAASIGVPVTTIQGVLSELGTLGLVRPRNPDEAHRLVEGYCVITPNGLGFLDSFDQEARLREKTPAEPELERLRPAGFILPLSG